MNENIMLKGTHYLPVYDKHTDINKIRGFLTTTFYIIIKHFFFD